MYFDTKSIKRPCIGKTPRFEKKCNVQLAKHTSEEKFEVSFQSKNTSPMLIELFQKLP